MDNTILYNNIFKRKSFHKFMCNTYPLSNDEINDIYEVYKTLTPLYNNIKTDIKIVKSKEVSMKRDNEYCILLFSEKKDNYLENIGYLGEQLDLYLVSKNIGTLWYGIGKYLKKYNDLSYVIMMGISKVDETSFRKDMFKSKRRELCEIWSGLELPFSNIIRFAPSACNSQPWYVENSNNELSIYRIKKQGRVGIMPIVLVSYYNQIDIGIFLLFLEVCLKQYNYSYSKELFNDTDDREKILIAKYKIHKH